MVARAAIEVVSTHSRAKAADTVVTIPRKPGIVSTHSRAKAADPRYKLSICSLLGFNTQPREGG